MSSPSPRSRYLRRALSSLVAIAAVSVIFGAKAFESQQAVNSASPPLALTDITPK
jgi:hypothetical protein